MPGNYLRQLQLTKQLERQAKEAAKNREAAEESIGEVEEAIQTAERMGANVSQGKKFLVESNDSFSNKDYKGSLGLAAKAMEEVMKAQRERISEIIRSGERLLDLLEDAREDSEAPYGLLEKGRRVMSEGELEQAYEIANEAWDKSEQFINSRMADYFGRAQSLLLLAEDKDIDVQGDREVLNRAREFLEKGDYETSLDRLNSCIGGVKSELENEFESRVDSMQNDVARMEEFEDQLSSVLDPVDEMRGLMSDGHMEEGFARLKILESDFRRTVFNCLDQEFNSLQKRSELLEEYGVDSDRLKEIIGEGRTLLRSDQRWEAMAKMREADERSIERGVEVLAGEINRISSRLVVASKIDVDVSESLELLKRAREDIREGDFESSLQHFNEAERMLQEETRGLDEVARELSEVSSLMTIAHTIDADLSDPLERMGGARELVLSGDVEEALPEIKGSKELLKSSIESKLGERIMRAEMMITSAIRMDLPVSEEDAAVESLIEMVEEENYRKTIEQLDRIEEGLKERLESRAQESLSRGEGMLEGLREEVDVSSVRSKLEGASDRLDAGEYADAFDLSTEAIEELEVLEEAEMERRLAEIDSLLSINERLGVESVTLNEKLDHTESLMREGETSQALEGAKEIIRFAVSIIEHELNDLMKDLLFSITDARKDGVSVGDLEGSVEDINEILDEGRVKEAYSKFQDLKDGLNDRIRTHEEMEEDLDELTGVLNQAKNSGLTVSRPWSKLEEALALFKKGRYEESQKALDLAEKLTEEQISPFISEKRVEEAKNVLAVARRRFIEVEDLEEEVERAESLLQGEEYSEVLSSAENIITELRGRLKDDVSQEIEKVKELISGSEEEMMDLASINKIVSKAEDLLERGKINDAMRAIKVVKNDLDQGVLKSKRARKEMEEAKALIDKIRTMGLNPSSAKKLLEQARTRYGEGKVETAADLAEQATKKAEELGKDCIQDRMKQLRMNYRAMNLEGEELDKAVQIEGKIKNALSQGRFERALSMFHSLEQEIDRVKKQKNLAERALESVSDRVREVEKEDLISKKVQSLLRGAEKRFEKGAFTESFSLSIQTGEELNAITRLHERRRKEVSELMSQIEQLEDDIEISEASALAHKGLDHLKDLEFEKASLYIRKCRSQIQRMMNGLYREKMKELESLMNLSYEVEIEEPGLSSSALKRASEGLQSIDMQILEELGEVILGTRERITEALEERINEVSGKVDVARNSGADVDISEKLLIQARNLLREDELEDVHALVEESEESIGEAVERRKEYVERKLRTESLIETGKRHGLIMNDAIEYFEEAENQGGDYSRAIEMMDQALELAEEEASSYLPEIRVNIDFLEGPVAGRWNDAMLRVRNEGESMAKDVRVELHGEIEARGLRPLKKLRGKEEKNIGIELFPRSSGTLTMGMTLICRPVLSQEDWGFEASFELEVE